MRPRLSR